MERLRAATLMQTFGAEMTGNQRTPAPDQAPADWAAFRGEEERRARLVTELQKARITGIERDRIEVRFDGGRTRWRGSTRWPTRS